MFGIVIDDHTDPYILGPTLESLRDIAAANVRLGYAVHYVYDVEECESCGDGLPGGWVEVDEHGDFIDPPLHDRCRTTYWQERYSDV